MSKRDPKRSEQIAEAQRRGTAARKTLEKAWGLGTELSKAEMVERLAAKRVADYPNLYAGHEDDARYFVRHNYPTKFDLALACKNQGISLD